MSRTDEFPGNVLSAGELLKHKGISCIAWKEYDRANNVLPKSGQKQFEPNNSRLQNLQIEKGLSNRKELLSIERVDRISQLAVAEWLPLQKKARVKKYSGQDWSSFGIEKNGALYLLPEEALFLLEANCLELLWNDVPMSVQQAYELLIDNEECSLEEYRVYSQLVRNGYKIQRYVYQYTDKEESNGKRKVIIDPNTGLRMDENQQPDDTSAKNSKNQATVTSANNLAQNARNNTNENVKEVLEDLLVSVEDLIDKSRDAPAEDRSLETNGSQKRSSKVEIISDEPLRGDVHVIFQKPTTSPSQDTQAVVQRGWRIQRNVKLVPKRLDKPSSSDVPLVDPNVKSNTNSNALIKRSSSLKPDHEISEKKPRHEVIEISDDEIQEVAKPLSKKELLDTMPNIAHQRVTEVKIQRRYIPYNIRPRKDVYYYNTNKLRNIHEKGKYGQQRYNHHYCHHTPCNQCNRTSNWNTNPYLSTMLMNTNVYTGFVQAPLANGPMNLGLFYFFNRFQNRHPPPYESNRYWNHHRGNKRPNRRPQYNDDVYNPSFKIIPGTASWSELKSKWREDKTITIDDEENVPISRDNADSEVQVLEGSTNPLIGPKNASTLAKIFERLKIIKSAPEKTVRRKRGRYKISYNIYSNTQHYTKANPGPPLYRVIVKGQKDDQLVQPIELHRLLRDADDTPIVFACVSMSISYIQPGFVTIPDAT